MGSSESTVGSIVWVRRRNGSWWPGKILGPDELSSSHLMSPRSGTPVKLLGREDASVDWYNLEKSKRVKAFRCGEFDDCIERAEASLGLPTKRREKYARREDAILHALELEKQFLQKKHEQLAISNFMKKKSPDSGRIALATSSEALKNGKGKSGTLELYPIDKKIDASGIVEILNTPRHEHKAKDKTYSSLQEQNAEVSYHMRGLAIPGNRIIYTSTSFGDSNKLALDGHACGVSTHAPYCESSSDSDHRKSISKGERSFEGFVEASLPESHHRPHAEVDSLQHSDFIPLYGKQHSGAGRRHSEYLPVESSGTYDSYCGAQKKMKIPTSQLDEANCSPPHGTFAEETTSGSSEETESDSSETCSLEHVEARIMLPDAETPIEAQAMRHDSSEMQGRNESTSSDDTDKLSFDRPRFYICEPNPSGFGVSKWLLKRKRNARNFHKRPMNRFSDRAYLGGRGSSLRQGVQNHSLGHCHENDYIDDYVDFIVGDLDPLTQGLRFPSQAASEGSNCVGQNIIDWEDLAWGRPLRGYCEKRSGCFKPTFGGQLGHDLLVDVDLKVQANRQGEHVPWVSLMSRLNGKAIIGHPIQVEALEDGSTDILESTSDLNYEINENRIAPSWSTARRKAKIRVPHPHLLSESEVNEVAENQYLHQFGKVQSKKSVAPSTFQGRSMKKTHTDIPASPVQGMKKPPRKMNPSSNENIVSLSSSKFDQKLKKRRRDKNSNYNMDGLIKSMDSGPPAVACIPVKLVFCRLLDAVGRAPAKHGFSVNSSKQRKPS
ncbi:hypothetical protein Cgig2_017755 [Carnegiea gigantea]|uniref:PWWP domain-containing protein n=1 Tax=Carnegiea gigantea TaxID=171969 RepID=A0A9Q1QRD9_9CARY|nr:hypothetical protein Cgig2_017755 [Carnegiea gigantea]